LKIALPRSTRLPGWMSALAENGTITRRGPWRCSVFLPVNAVRDIHCKAPNDFPLHPRACSPSREAPAVLDALEQLYTLPDLLICDGQGHCSPAPPGHRQPPGAALTRYPHRLAAREIALTGLHAPLGATRAVSASRYGIAGDALSAQLCARAPAQSPYTSRPVTASALENRHRSRPALYPSLPAARNHTPRASPGFTSCKRPGES